MTQQRLGPKLAEGKTKIIYAHPDDPALAIMLHKDSISAGDGARRNTITGKGALSGRTAANVFALLNSAGIATHFVAAPEPTVMVVRGESPPARISSATPKSARAHASIRR